MTYIPELQEPPVTEEELEKFRIQWDGKSPIPERLMIYGCKKIIDDSERSMQELDYLLKHPSIQE